MSESGVRAGPGEGWLREENPDLYYMLQALAGDGEAFRWLELKSEGLGLFTRAAAGDRKACVTLQSSRDLDLDGVYGAIDDPGLSQWLHDSHPDLHLLFEAIRGDEAALRRLKRKKAALGKLALTVRPLYQEHQRDNPDEVLAEEAASAVPPEIPEDAAADVGCLIGEMHLKQGDFAKAVEAFTRSLETDPSADAYEGRARAYRGLALLDERKAQELRGGA